MKKRTKAIAAIAIAFYVAGIITAIHAVMTVRTPQGAIAWSVSLVSFPFVAVPAYLVFGRSKFEGMVQAYDARRTEIDALEAQVRRNIDPWVAEAELRPAIYTAVRRLTGMALTHGNDVELLIDGEATFVSLLKGIAQANDYILFQFYMIHDDELGRRVQQALIERAKAGVRVYVLYDEIGSNGLPPSYVHALREAGVEVSPFGATQGLRNRFQLNFRNHRKMVVVDGVTGWVGGHNVGDEYLGHDPEFTPWRDTHVHLEGPVVTQLQAVIAQDWYWATRKIPKLNWTPRAAANGNVRAMITPTAPTTQLETSGLLFVAALDSARERIWITAPYFVP
ncbi:MAG TPA: phospholipase D-like domain-containing protein, partial [Steroidobacteraceae bacterium]|nr:phospholipase D-like domain-containing protein [Steroidobacteraceae bacterium]